MHKILHGLGLTLFLFIGLMVVGADSIFNFLPEEKPHELQPNNHKVTARDWTRISFDIFKNSFGWSMGSIEFDDYGECQHTQCGQVWMDTNIKRSNTAFLPNKRRLVKFWVDVTEDIMELDFGNILHCGPYTVGQDVKLKEYSGFEYIGSERDDLCTVTNTEKFRQFMVRQPG